MAEYEIFSSQYRLTQFIDTIHATMVAAFNVNRAHTEFFSVVDWAWLFRSVEDFLIGMGPDMPRAILDFGRAEYMAKFLHPDDDDDI